MRKNYGQIKDHKGNSIAASQASRKLYDAGWRICWLERKGMFKKVLWVRLADPQREVFDQAQALLIQKDLDKAKKAWRCEICGQNSTNCNGHIGEGFG